jgi:queuine tRNA-ribosyltransferase
VEKQILLPNGTIRLPEFLPDATRGVVRSVDSHDLEECGVQALVMNTFHLMQHPGSSSIQALGGLHKMSGWSKPIITDSGGFQIYSLIRQNPKFGSLSNKGAIFRIDDSGRKFNLSPEKSIQLQLSYAADIVVCLDDCTHVDSPYEVQEESVMRTIDWARRSKTEFVRLVGQKTYNDDRRPLLFGVIQGGGYPELRKRCAEALLEVGFDGYGYGGWPLDSAGNLLVDILAHTRQLVPSEFPMHALGVAHPQNVAICARLGYELSDGAMPTRDARHGRLYQYNVDPSHPSTRLEGKWFSYVYALDDKYIKSATPISPYCDCPLCQHYSLGYLHHLFKVKDALSLRLATLHNLRFMTQLTAYLRKELHGASDSA